MYRGGAGGKGENGENRGPVSTARKDLGENAADPRANGPGKTPRSEECDLSKKGRALRKKSRASSNEAEAISKKREGLSLETAKAKQSVGKRDGKA